MTESDHKKAYQEYLKEKTFRTVVIYFAIKNKYVFYQICGRYIRCYVLPVIVYFAGKNLRKISVLEYIYFLKTFYKI
jgi:hypothetical protein